MLKYIKNSPVIDVEKLIFSALSMVTIHIHAEHNVKLRNQLMITSLEEKDQKHTLGCSHCTGSTVDKSLHGFPSKSPNGLFPVPTSPHTTNETTS